jgi:hypothetical protein
LGPIGRSMKVFGPVALAEADSSHWSPGSVTGCVLSGFPVFCCAFLDNNWVEYVKVQN